MGPRHSRSLCQPPHHHDVATRGQALAALDLQWRLGVGRLAGSHHRRSGALEIEHQTIGRAFARTKDEAFHLYRMGQLQHHPGVLGAIVSAAHGAHRRSLQGEVIEHRGGLGIGEIENDAIRRDQGEGLVAHRSGEIEDQAELLGILPGPGTL